MSSFFAKLDLHRVQSCVKVAVDFVSHDNHSMRKAAFQSCQTPNLPAFSAKLLQTVGIIVRFKVLNRSSLS